MTGQDELLERVSALVDRPVAELVGAEGFRGSSITEWCRSCGDWCVPMANGTCGFCGERTVHLRDAFTVLGPPTEIGQRPSPPPRVQRRGKTGRHVLLDRELERRIPLRKGQQGFGPTCACGGPKSKQAHQCKRCWIAAGRPGAGGKGVPRPDVRGPYGVSENLMLEARRLYNDEQMSMRAIAAALYDQAYGYSTVRSLGEALYRGFRNRGWRLRSRSDALRLRNWKHGLKPRVQTSEEQTAYRHWFAAQRGWRSVRGPGNPRCQGTKRNSPGKGTQCTARAMEGSDFCFAHAPERAPERAALVARMRAAISPADRVRSIERARAIAMQRLAEKRFAHEAARRGPAT